MRPVQLRQGAPVAVAMQQLATLQPTCTSCQAAAVAAPNAMPFSKPPPTSYPAVHIPAASGASSTSPTSKASSGPSAGDVEAQCCGCYECVCMERTLYEPYRCPAACAPCVSTSPRQVVCIAFAFLFITAVALAAAFLRARS